MFFILTGRNGSGKSTVTAYLRKKGFVSFSLSDELRYILTEQGLPLDRETMIAQGNKYRKELGTDFLAQQVLSKIKNLSQNIVVDSVRSPDEVLCLRKKANAIILFLDAEQEKRFQRSKKRTARGDTENFEIFSKQDEKEWLGSHDTQNINEVAKMADETIVNNDTLANFYKQLDLLIAKYDTQ